MLNSWFRGGWSLPFSAFAVEDLSILKATSVKFQSCLSLPLSQARVAAAQIGLPSAQLQVVGDVVERVEGRPRLRLLEFESYN